MDSTKLLKAARDALEKKDKKRVKTMIKPRKPIVIRKSTGVASRRRRIAE